MKKTAKLLPALLLILLAAGCTSTSGLGIQAGYTGELFKFKGAYVGDASAVGNIASSLNGAGQYSGFELKTDEEPYGTILNYSEGGTEQQHKEIAVYNAAYLFTLIQNADWITCNFAGEEYTVTKERMRDWYGEDFTAWQSEEEVESSVQKKLDDTDAVGRLFEEDRGQ